jgi:hypothetical protein
MKFYLLAAGQAQGPFDEEEVVQAYEEGDIDESAQVRPETSEEWLPLGSLIEHVDMGGNGNRITSGNGVMSSGPARLEIAPRSYLKGLRGNTCYPVLRSVIDVAAILMAATVLIWWFLPIATLVLHKRLFLLDPSNDVLTAVLTVVLNTLLCALSIMVVIGLRQAAFVGIDISDTLLAHHARARGENFD